jgi:hypothetical protein
MMNRIAHKNQTTRRILFVACVAALVGAFTVSLPQMAHAEDIIVPPTQSCFSKYRNRPVPTS